VFNGPCSFTETARVKCVQITDDYYAFITRRLPQGATLDVTINVEFYTHPDTYRGLVQVYLGVVKGTQLYSWGNRQATATVEPGAHRLTLAFTRAGPWAGTLAADMETISGTLVCKSLEH
jgi:hypothetical protein